MLRGSAKALSLFTPTGALLTYILILVVVKWCTGGVLLVTLSCALLKPYTKKVWCWRYPSMCAGNSEYQNRVVVMRMRIEMQITLICRRKYESFALAFANANTNNSHYDYQAQIGIIRITICKRKSFVFTNALDSHLQAQMRITSIYKRKCEWFSKGEWFSFRLLVSEKVIHSLSTVLSTGRVIHRLSTGSYPQALIHSLSTWG